MRLVLLLRSLCLAVLLLLAATPALAQLGVPCDELLAEAQERYEARQFEAAATAAQACAARSGLPPETAVRAYRLIALASLRLEAIPDAEAAIQSLLRVDPTYEPDPIADPPLYVAFVEGAKARFQAPPPPAPVPAPEVTRRGPALSVGLQLGVGSYGGERGVNAGSGIGEFTENAGFTGGLSVAAAWSPVLSTGLRLQAYHLPTRFHLDYAPPVFLREEDSSAWTYVLTAEVIGRFQVDAPVQPGASFGLGAAFSRLNDATEVGLVLQPGLRLDIPLVPEWTATLNLETAFVLPSDALDLRSTSGVGPNARDTSLDLVPSLGLGLRYHITR